MQRITKSLLVSGLVALLVVLSAAPASAGNPHERPYKASGSGTLTTEGPAECDLSALPLVLCDFEYAGTGLATHVGLYTNTNTGVATIDLSAACVDAEGTPGSAISTSADGVIVAANGAELWYHSEADGCFTGAGLDLVTTQTFVGGTGRFTGASGTQSVESVTVDTESHSSTVGTIVY